MATTPELLALSQFSSMKGEAFALHNDAGAALPVILVEAQALSAPPGAARVPFTLLFQGPGQPALPQATYGLAHAALGPAPLDIFLVPVSRGPAGVRYEAVFN